MEVEQVQLSLLREQEANPREHCEDNLRAIAGSLVQYGQVLPLLVNRETMEIVAGNGRLVAMERLGWHECSVIFADGIEPEKMQSLGIMLNRTGDLSGWNHELLSNALDEMEADGLDVPALTAFFPGNLESLLAEPSGIDISSHQADAMDLPEGADATRCRPIVVTPEQRETIEQAVVLLREREGVDLTEGRCVELMAAEYLSGR